MALVTGKIQWRSNTANKSLIKMIQTIRDFVVANGWTMIDDRSSASATDPYIVVKSVRSTGFAGDDPIVQIGATSQVGVTGIVGGGGLGLPFPAGSSGSFGVWHHSPYLYIRAWESWNAVTHVGTNPTPWPGANNGGYATTQNIVYCGNGSNIAFQLTHDTDVWVSVAPEHILFTSRWGAFDSSGYVDGNGFSIVCGVTCIERLPGDVDTGSFYGIFNSFAWFDKKFYVPKRWDGTVNGTATFPAAYYNLSTKLGWSDLRGLTGIDEAGRHLVLDIGVNAPQVGKFKGKLYGVGATTYGFDLGHGLLMPSAAAPQWIVSKYNGLQSSSLSNYGDQRMTMAMQVASVIQVL